MSIKLLQITNYYYPHTGGIEQVTRNIKESLDDFDIEQRIICFNEDASKNNIRTKRNETVREVLDGTLVIRCACFAKVASQSLSFVYHNILKGLLIEFDPDIIIFHYPNPFVSTLLLPLLKDHQKLIVFWHLDITKQKILGKLFDKQNHKLLSRADRIIATSPNYIKGSPYLSKYKEKCIVIPNCISDDFKEINEEIINKSKEIRNKYKDKCLCFSIGRHVPYKGYEYLIEASTHLDDNYKILIGGKGPLTNKLKELSKDNDKVELIGYVSDDDLKAYYLAADIITFPSITKNEAFGISLAEGMYFSKPAITFNIPGSGVNYVNINNETGIEVENRNSKEYANAIKELYTNKEKYNEYSKNAKIRVEELFMFDNFKDNIIKLLNYMK